VEYDLKGEGVPSSRGKHIGVEEVGVIKKCEYRRGGVERVFLILLKERGGGKANERGGWGSRGGEKKKGLGYETYRR